jgi:hypothetical protein
MLSLVLRIDVIKGMKLFYESQCPYFLKDVFISDNWSLSQMLSGDLIFK